jgi:hypothetical protein
LVIHLVYKSLLLLLLRATLKCQNCSYEWEPRVPDPKSCPRCKYRFYYASRRGREKTGEEIDKEEVLHGRKLQEQYGGGVTFEDGTEVSLTASEWKMVYGLEDSGMEHETAVRQVAQIAGKTPAKPQKKPRAEVVESSIERIARMAMEEAEIRDKETERLE